jgi:hypothetical protein
VNSAAVSSAGVVELVKDAGIDGGGGGEGCGTADEFGGVTRSVRGRVRGGASLDRWGEVGEAVVEVGDAGFGRRCGRGWVRIWS